MGSGLLFATLTGLCWAVLAIGLKYALHFASSGTIVWMRMSVAFLLLIGIYAIASPKSIKKVFLSPPKLGIWAGLLLATNYFGYMKGIELTTAANAQIMIQLGPLLFLFLGVSYFKEELRLIQWAGILIAGTGFAFFNWDQILISLDQRGTYIMGNMWVLLAALTWAIYAGFQKVLMQRGWTPQEVNLLIYSLSTVVLLPLVTPSEFYTFTSFQWFILFLLGVNTLIAYGSFAEAVKRAPASYVSLIISVNPLLTLYLLYLLEAFQIKLIAPEPISWRGYLGALLVVTGVAIAVSLKKRKSRKLVLPT